MKEGRDLPSTVPSTLSLIKDGLRSGLCFTRSGVAVAPGSSAAYSFGANSVAEEEEEELYATVISWIAPSVLRPWLLLLLAVLVRPLACVFFIDFRAAFRSFLSVAFCSFSIFFIDCKRAKEGGGEFE